ncbi:MAG: cytochrome C, partial [gamma proteobacterium symbiont of Ctena orbiculata]
DLSEQDRSARKRHPKAMDEGKACIDCHKGVAHEEPDEPDEPE